MFDLKKMKNFKNCYKLIYISLFLILIKCPDKHNHQPQITILDPPEERIKLLLFLLAKVLSKKPSLCVKVKIHRPFLIFTN